MLPIDLACFKSEVDLNSRGGFLQGEQYQLVVRGSIEAAEEAGEMLQNFALMHYKKKKKAVKASELYCETQLSGHQYSADE